jgi:hypothetical protein
MNTMHDQTLASSSDATPALMKSKVNSYYSSRFFELALTQQTIGLSRFTPLGVGCSWFSDPAEWLSIDTTCNKCQDSVFYPVLDSVVHNILKEQMSLAHGLVKPDLKSSPDVLAAYQSIDQIRNLTEESASVI